MYVLVISNKRTAGTLTFVKTMAVFSAVCHVLLCTSMLAFAYQMPTKGTMQKVTQHIWLTLTRPCQVAGCVVKTDWYIILIGRKLMLEI